MTTVARSEHAAYSPKAVYYEASDSLEYIRRDDPAVYRRVDELLTLVLDLHTRTPLGFKLKGFRHFYLTHVRPKYPAEGQFLSAINVLEDAMSLAGNALFQETERRRAYKDALEIASEDNVSVERPRRVVGK